MFIYLNERWFLRDFLLACLFLFIFSVSAFADPDTDPAEHLYSHIRKIDNDLYFSKMSEHGFYMAMERVTLTNLNSWSRYAKVQANSRLVSWAAAQVKKDERGNNIPLQKGYLVDGSSLLGSVLENYGSDREIWVAYITALSEPQHIPESVECYITDDVSAYGSAGSSFTENIKMFVSVTSSRSHY